MAICSFLGYVYKNCVCLITYYDLRCLLFSGTNWIKQVYCIENSLICLNVSCVHYTSIITYEDKLQVQHSNSIYICNNILPLSISLTYTITNIIGYSLCIPWIHIIVWPWAIYNFTDKKTLHIPKISWIKMQDFNIIT